jgi:hypothetical protein
MEGRGEEGSPRRELTTESSWYKPGMSHEQLVKAAQGYIQQRQHLYAELGLPDQKEASSPVAIIRSGIEQESQSWHSDDEKVDKEKRRFFYQLGYAWDALAYDCYEPGSSADHMAVPNLSSYYQHSRATGEKSTIKLDPVQVQIIDALTEAVGIPHKKGQAEIEIPEKLRSETKWLLSEEYQERLLKAAARARGENPEGPSQESTVQSNTHQKGQNEPHNHGAADNPLIERDEFYPAFWDRLIQKSSISPSGEDPAFWPIMMLNELTDLINNREYIRDKTKHALAKKIAPLKETIRKVETAYEIIAYPYCKQVGRQDVIEAWLESDRQAYGRGSVELNDTELEIVRKLCEIPRYALHGNIKTLQPEIPFDPQKRIYNHSEVLNSSSEKIR